MRKLLTACLLALAAAGIAALPPAEEERSGGRIEAYEVQREGRTHLLLRLEGKAAGTIDQIVVHLSPGDPAGEYEILAPPSWRLEKSSRLSRLNPLRRGGKPSLVLTGPATRTPVYVRLQGPRPRDRRIDVEGLRDGRPFAGVTGLPVVPFPAPESNLARVALFPPIVSPGEVIEFSPLDLRKTPPGGIWRLGGTAAAPGEAGRLRVRVPPDVHPAGPLMVTYTDPWGESPVAAPALTQVRILPPPEGEPAHAQLDVCDSHFIQGKVCLCGWFPDAAKNGIRIDGEPRSPAAASRQSMCFSLPPGPHQLSGLPSAGLPDARFDLQAISLPPIPPPPTRVGQPLSLTWRVLGTSSPIRVQLRNTTPQIVRLEGGNLQMTTSSGGEPNVITRTGQTLAPGNYHVEATLPEEISPFQSRAYLKILEKSFQREMGRSSDTFASARRRLESSNARFYPAAEVQRLVRDTRSELLRSLAQPELAAFRDYADEFLSEVEGTIAAKSASAARQPSRGAPATVPASFRPAAAKPEGAIEKKQADPLLKRVGDFLNQFRRAPLVRHLYVQSLPIQEASVKIYPRSYPSAEYTGFTDRAFCNLPLGRYVYEVTLPKYQTITGFTLDLVRDQQQVLDCRLKSFGGKAVPCSLSPGVARGCQ